MEMIVNNIKQMKCIQVIKSNRNFSYENKYLKFERSNGKFSIDSREHFLYNSQEFAGLSGIDIAVSKNSVLFLIEHAMSSENYFYPS
jgi:hypothetical protein